MNVLEALEKILKSGAFNGGEHIVFNGTMHQFELRDENTIRAKGETISDLVLNYVKDMPLHVDNLETVLKGIEEIKASIQLLSQSAAYDPAAGEKIELVNHLNWLREKGWVVAAHYDRPVEPIPFTSWLFTKGSRYVKGDGRTDLLALQHVRSEVSNMMLAEGLQGAKR